MRHILVLAVFFPIMLLAGGILQPASSQIDCAVESDYSFYLLNFDVVFIGTATKSATWDADKEWQNIQFEIEYPVKGIDNDQSAIDIITSENNDGFQFHIGSKYLVHAGKAYDVDLFTGMCSNNKMLSPEYKVANQLSKIYDIRSNMSPLKQFESGTPADKIQCRENLILILKHDGSPACVKPETHEKLMQRDWTDYDEIKNMLSSKDTGFSDVEKLLVENKIDYLQDRLVVTVGPSISGDPGCGAVVDTDSETHWFGIDSISNPTTMTLFSENPQQCTVNTGSCFCNAQIELASLTLDELIYFSPVEQEQYSEILIDYLYDQNINRTPNFQIGKLNVNYTDSSAIGYCGHIWGTNTYDFFSGAIVNNTVHDYRIDKELPLLCAISDGAKWLGK